MSKIVFCEKCNGLLRVFVSDGEIIGECIQCKLSIGIGESLSFSEKRKMDKIGRGIACEVKTKGFPHVCKKCLHEECEISDLGAFYSDESNVYLYKCMKCGYVERQADGTGNS